jgi:hypothetical protein
MSNPFSRSAIRREFPNERLPDIVGATGKVSRGALRTWFSAMGCPVADPEIAAAVLKSGGSQTQALQLAIFTAYYLYKHGPMIEPMQRYADGMMHAARELAARHAPWGKEAEDRAARLEGRESRWGTDDFHSNAHGSLNAVRTLHYPCAVDGPVRA